tara:strand:+ start:7802 stop:8077 length:276 start_codon:yes stop_codon:yes gene_type:complete
MATKNLILSDRAKMKNIQNTGGVSASGIKIYRFNYEVGYIDQLIEEFGDELEFYGTFQGAIADEVDQEFVTPHFDGDYIDYSLIDVEFKKI